MESNKIGLTVSRIEHPTRDCAQVFLEPDHGVKVAYEAGQFLTFVFPNLGPTEIRRSYSLAAAPATGEPLSICVKRTENGRASSWLTRKLAVGDRLQSLRPAGQFRLPAPSEGGQGLLFVGGGSGIVPLFSMIKEALLTQPNRRLRLIYANRSEQKIIFREELKAWQRRFPDRLRIIHWLSAPDDSVDLGAAEGLDTVVRPGRLSNMALEQLVKLELGEQLDTAHAFLCGPPGLMLKAEMTLRFLQFSEQRLHKEDFIIHEPFRPKADTLADSKVTVRQGSQSWQFDLKAGQSVLEAALAAGVELPYSCRSGTCTTCSAQLSKGRVDMYTNDSRVDSNATHGHIFTCVSYPLTEETVMEIR
jgi:ring-1,2-phenylacetyl-CoA epoxidase subunit PaaE